MGVVEEEGVDPEEEALVEVSMGGGGGGGGGCPMYYRINFTVQSFRFR